MLLKRTSNRSAIKLEVTRLEGLVNLLGVILLRNLLQQGLVRISIAGDGILEHAGVVHVDILIVYACGFSLCNHLLPEAVNKAIYGLIISFVGPPAGDVHKMNRALRTIQPESVAAMVLHVVEHWLGDSLVDEDGLGASNIGDLGNHRVEKCDNPVGELLVKLEGEWPVYLTKAERVLELEILDVLD